MNSRRFISQSQITLIQAARLTSVRWKAHSSKLLATTSDTLFSWVIINLCRGCTEHFVTEKNHWKERITKRIQRAIEELLAKHDPTFNAKIEQQARTRAIESLGISASYQRLDAIKANIKSLEAERAEIL